MSSHCENPNVKCPCDSCKDCPFNVLEYEVRLDTKTGG